MIVKVKKILVDKVVNVHEWWGNHYPEMGQVHTASISLAKYKGKKVRITIMEV